MSTRRYLVIDSSTPSGQLVDVGSGLFLDQEPRVKNPLFFLLVTVSSPFYAVSPLVSLSLSQFLHSSPGRPLHHFWLSSFFPVSFLLIQNSFSFVFLFYASLFLILAHVIFFSSHFFYSFAILFPLLSVGALSTPTTLHSHILHQLKSSHS